MVPPFDTVLSMSLATPTRKPNPSRTQGERKAI
jgi:hypothetical protein